jgi:hypothetical protein
MTPFQPDETLHQLLMATRFDSSKLAMIHSPEPGIYALFKWGGEVQILAVGTCLADLQDAFDTRPAYKPSTPRPSKATLTSNLLEQI